MQFDTLLLYLNDMCIFAPDVDTILYQTQILFYGLKVSISKINLRSETYFNQVLCFGPYLSADGILSYLKKVNKGKNWSVSNNVKVFQSFLDLAFYYRHFILSAIHLAQSSYNLIGLINNKKIISMHKDGQSKSI